MSGSSSAVEIDFFRLNGESSAIPPVQKKLSDRLDIQGVISKINPELLKTAIASASANRNSVSKKSSSSTQEPQLAVPDLPVYNQNGGCIDITRSDAPLTIFYNGTVIVFDVSPHQAENIMRLVEIGNSGSKAVTHESIDVKPVPSPSNQNPAIGGVINRADLPMSRKKSLKRFLEKRKERQIYVSPYANYKEDSIFALKKTN